MLEGGSICPRVQKEDVRSGRRGGTEPLSFMECFILTATRQYSHFTDENLRLPGAASQAHSPGADSEKPGFKPRAGTVQGRPCPLCCLRCKAGTWHVTAARHTPRARMAGGPHRALGRRGPKKLSGEARDCPGRVITRGFDCCSVYCVLSRGGLPSLGC